MFIFTLGMHHLRPVQTLATLLANKTQHCWAQHVASVCTPCCVLLRLVRSCWMKLETGQTSSNNFQQIATIRKNTQHGVQTLATCWAQQCCVLLANNVASVCAGLYPLLLLPTKIYEISMSLKRCASPLERTESK